MRFCVSRSRKFSPSFLHHPLFYHRKFHHAYSLTKEPTIFQNSLEKTLEVHRSFNRASLIRKVILRPGTQEASHPAASSESSRENIPPNKASGSDAEAPREFTESSRLGNDKRKSRRLPRKYCSSPLPTVPSQPLRWDVDFTNGRPVQRPWLDGLGQDVTFLDGLSQLDVELCALDKYLSPPPREKKTIDAIVSDITSLLRGSLPLPLQMIGSRRTGFAMSHSSLDLLLPVQDLVRPVDSIRRPSANRPKMLGVHKEMLQGVERILRQHPLFCSMNFNPFGKRQRILTAIHQPTGMLLQLYCGQDLPASIEYTRDFHVEYPLIRPLYMSTRLILESQGLLGCDKSSLTPEALLMLLASFLKMNHGRFQRTAGCGELLLGFLRTYGLEVNLATTGIAVDPPGFFDAESVKETNAIYCKETLEDFPAHIRGQRALINMKKRAADRGNKSLASQLCLQDPANYMNDLGRSCSRTRELQTAFAVAYGRINSAVSNWEACGSFDPSNSILGRALRVNFNDFNTRRAALRASPPYEIKDGI